MPSKLEMLEEVARLVLQVVPCLEVRSWPPGFELKKKLLADAKAALSDPKDPGTGMREVEEMVGALLGRAGDHFRRDGGIGPVHHAKTVLLRTIRSALDAQHQEGLEAAARLLEREKVVCNGPLPESVAVLTGGIEACLRDLATRIRSLPPTDPHAHDSCATVGEDGLCGIHPPGYPGCVSTVAPPQRILCDCCGHPPHDGRMCQHPEPTWHEGMCHCAGSTVGRAPAAPPAPARAPVCPACRGRGTGDGVREARCSVCKGSGRAPAPPPAEGPLTREQIEAALEKGRKDAAAWEPALSSVFPGGDRLYRAPAEGPAPTLVTCEKEQHGAHVQRDDCLLPKCSHGWTVPTCVTCYPPAAAQPEATACPCCGQPVKQRTLAGLLWAECAGSPGRAACEWSGPASRCIGSPAAPKERV